MLTLTVVATKGGVGKTTLSANLGGLLADLGYRVLLVDADVQPSLTRYFKLSHAAENGLTNMVMGGILSADCVSHIELPPEDFPGDHSRLNVQGGFMHLVASDTRDGRLQDWLSNRLDRLVRIRMSLASADVQRDYDVVIIDTQGAVGHLQDAAVNAADILIAPASPDIVSAREFVDGTLKLMERLESSVNMGFTVPAMKAIINRVERTVDSDAMSGLIRNQFLEMRGRVSVLSTTVPSTVAYKKAATAQVPVHWIDPIKAGDVMHALLWELIPSLVNKYAPNHRGEIVQAIRPAHESPAEPEPKEEAGPAGSTASA